jgi:phosphohistidine swiveling domain-containing protein
VSDERHLPLVLAINAAAATLEQVGGKGASLARMAAAGLPVPSGFYLTTAAYRRFVAEYGLQDAILAAVSGIAADQPTALDEASRRIGSLFAQHAMPDDIAEAIRRAYAELGGGEMRVAVRSSATAEDLPGMSFAGQQETYLNIHGDAMVLKAVKRCWASLWTGRAIGYRSQHGIPPEEVSIAVVVQELVPADAAGILFTANPLTGARDQVMINAAWGLGEAIVGGQVTPDTVVVDRVSGTIVEEQISEKDVMTVRDLDGTHAEPVPADQRTRAVLSPAQAAELARIGVQIENLHGQPMDVEWALHDGHFFIVQARPITGLEGQTQPLEEWNDSLTGDYLWTNSNLGEAIPDVMTPCTWSLVKVFMSDAMATSSLPDYRGYGNIGGRFYMNLSVAASLSAAVGINRKRFAQLTGDVFGRLPDGMEIPLVDLPRWRVLRMLVPVAIGVLRRVHANKKRLLTFIATAPDRCDALRAWIRSASSPAELITLWWTEVEPIFHESCQMLEAATRQSGATLVTTRRKLQKLVGETDATAMLTGLQTGGSQLASLGPLLGLARLARGEIDRETYARNYGHRGPHEFEVSIPRPAEDPDWIDKQLASLDAAKEDTTALLARQEAARTAAWDRLRQRYPRRVRAMRRRVDRWAEIERAREEARSEVIRVFWVLRAFVLRTGELSGHGDDLFFLSIEEILAVLEGVNTQLTSIPARRATYERYRSLPPYPTLIRGRFDPFRWAADPHRRTDLFDARGYHAPASDVVRGFPGAPGVVEGLVRVIATAEEGDQLQAGEILVTTVTNVGWTPLFPRASAIVTDVGAPLSHAAIVARELGIPAVVGCGNAMMRLHTGDRVRVDGEEGMVEVLQAANAT